MPTRVIPPNHLTGLPAAELGLSNAEVTARQALFGYNDIIVTAPATWLDVARDTARDPMLWFLTGVSVLFVALGNVTEAAILAVALIPLVGMDAFLHRRTQASTQGLAARLAAQARVIRNAVALTVPARDLVPGDVVDVTAGEYFPADGLVIAGADIQVDESSLTGEAWPVRKQPLPESAIPPRAADTLHWAAAGTRLLTGHARLRIALTGGETLFGEIVRLAVMGVRARTPLQVAVNRLVTILLGAAVVMCAALAAIRLLQGKGLVDAFLSAVTLAVAAIPEEFPVVLTFFLGVGVYRLARCNALVRRAVAVENIGRVTCICSDKTGTLTEGRLALAHQAEAGDTSPGELLGLAALASRPESGDPLDAALIAASPADPGVERLGAFPFTEARRRETAIVRLGTGQCLAIVKGAPETVLAMCADPHRLQSFRERVDGYAASGHKVIAVATRTQPSALVPSAEPDTGYELRGVLALEDPVRDGVREAVAACRDAGIRVIMVTGDHPATAGAIAGEIGLGDGRPTVVNAEALAAGGDLIAGALVDVDAVARSTPAQKLQLVRALQAAGEIVAVTGDGVNDVPALHAADIGIAMGERGTQSAREAAAVVLLDDNFRTIVRAIAEGRQLFRNLRLAFTYLLLVHVPLVVSAAAVPLAGNPLLYLPIHIVWLELIIHPTALLVFQDLPVPGRLMPTGKGRPLRFFSAASWIALAVSGLVLATIITVGFEFALGPSNDVEHARSMALGALIAGTAAITITLSGLRSWASRVIVTVSLSSLLLGVQLPAIAALVHLRPLHLADWGIVAGAGLVAGVLAAVVLATIRRA